MREAIIKDIDVVAKDVLLHDSLYVGPNSEVTHSSSNACPWLPTEPADCGPTARS